MPNIIHSLIDNTTEESCDAQQFNGVIWAQIINKTSGILDVVQVP